MGQVIVLRSGVSAVSAVSRSAVPWAARSTAYVWSIDTYIDLETFLAHSPLNCL
jgi:hypothetical protein